MESTRRMDQSPPGEERNLVHQLRAANDDSEATNKLLSARRGGGATGLAGYDTPKIPSGGVDKMFKAMGQDDEDQILEEDVKQKEMSKTVEAPTTFSLNKFGKETTGNLKQTEQTMPAPMSKNIAERASQTKVGDQPSLESSNERPPKLIVNAAPVARSPNKKYRYGTDGKGFDELVRESKIAESDLNKLLDTSPMSKQRSSVKMQNDDHRNVEKTGPSALTLHDAKANELNESQREAAGPVEDDAATEKQPGQKLDILSLSGPEEDIIQKLELQVGNVDDVGVRKDSESPDPSPAATPGLKIPPVNASGAASKQEDFTLDPKGVSNEPSRDDDMKPTSKQVSLTNTAGRSENPILDETIRLQRLAEMKEKVKEKKVVEYESETIELYEMISSEFDYEKLRLESPHFAIKQYKDSIYRGEINKKRKRHGKGVVVYDAGRIYEGEWLEDKRGGRGFELFSNGNKYQGQYANGKAHGKGTYTWTNGEVYEGEWKAGQKHGTGFWRGIQGDSYLGQWQNSKAEGYGVHTWLDGDRYEGEWRQCLRHGTGTDFFSNGDVYVGQYLGGKPEGFGQYKWANGNTYTGEFLNGMKHGKGKWKKRLLDGNESSSGGGSKLCNMYDGYYEMDKKHGYGEFQWESGNKYIGNYHQDERQGYGTMKWTDGSQYMGHWECGVQHGIGVMTFPDGVKRAGFFENNMFVITLKTREQMKELENDMPVDILNELLAFLANREKRLDDLRAQGVSDVEEHLQRIDEEVLGQVMPAKQPDTEEAIDQINSVKGMAQLGTAVSPDKAMIDNFVNYEGLKRVYKPRDERDKYQSDLEKQAQEAGLHVIEERQEDGTISRIVEKYDPVTGQKQQVVERRDANGNILPPHNEEKQKELFKLIDSARQQQNQQPQAQGAAKEMQVQTDLNMETIFRYELSLNPYAGPLTTTHSNEQRKFLRTPGNQAQNQTRPGKNDSGKSDNLARQLHDQSSSNQNRTTIEGGTYRGKSQNANAEHSDFGQMYRASEEFPNSFKRGSSDEQNNLANKVAGDGAFVDESISFTDLQGAEDQPDPNARKVNTRIKLENSARGVGKRDAGVNVELKKYAMLKTTQNIRDGQKRRHNFFDGVAGVHGGSSFKGGTSDEENDQEGADLANQEQVSFPRTERKPPRQDGAQSNSLKKRRVSHLPVLNLQDPSVNPAELEALSPGEAGGRANLKLDDEIGNISVSEVSKLPTVPDRRSGMSLTQKHKDLASRQERSFFSKFQKDNLKRRSDLERIASGSDAGAQSIEDFAHRRRKASAIVEADYHLEDVDDGPLRFNEFELVPRARETFHQGLGFRPHLELAAQQQMRHTMYNPSQSDLHGEALFMQPSQRHLNNDASRLAGGNHEPASTGRNLMNKLLAANNESIQNLANQQSHQLFQSLQQSHHQIPVNPRALKKKKLKKVKGFRAKAPLPLRQGGSPKARVSPIRIVKDHKRTASVSVKNEAQSIFKPPLSSIRIAPQGYVSSSGMHSTSNKVSQIYRQPIVGFQSQSVGKPPLPRAMALGNSPAHSQMQSVSTQDHSRQLNFALQQSLNQNVMLSSDNQSYANSGLNSFAKKKHSAGAVLPALTSQARIGGNQLPPLNFKSLNYHQHQNSIQAIEVSNGSNNDGGAEGLSDGQQNDSSGRKRKNTLDPIQEAGPNSGKVGGKKRRKRVWIPASSVRRLGINAAAALID